METSYEPNTPDRYSVPPEIKKWNWGAFFLSWIWGLAHNTYIALLVFVPVIGLFVPFILGFKGSEWAWRNREWQSVEAFQERQRKWAWAGFIFTVTMLVFVIAITSAIFVSLANIEPVDKALAIANNNTEAVYYLGKPLEKGYLVTGSVNIEGPSGYADLAVISLVGAEKHITNNGSHGSATLWPNSLVVTPFARMSGNQVGKGRANK